MKVARQTVALLQRGEPLLRRQEILELLGQKIEAARQLPKLITGCVGSQRSEVPFAPLFDCERELLEAKGEAARGQESKQGANERRQDRHRQGKLHSSC